MTETLVAGLLAGYGIAMPVGGMSILIVTLSAQTSLRTGFAAAMGTATADGLYALVAVVTGTALVAVLQPVARPMRWAAAAILLTIAAKGIISALRRARSTLPMPAMGAKRPWHVYLELLGLTLLNPLTIVYFSALVLGRHSAAWSPARAVVFVLGAFAASASWQAVLALGGVLIGRTLTSDRGRVATAMIGNSVIIVLAFQLLATAR